VTDDKFALLQSTAGEISQAFLKHERLIEQRRTVVRELEAANAFFDKAFASNGTLDLTAPQRKILESSALLADCEKRVAKAQEELIEACACVYAEGFFK